MERPWFIIRILTELELRVGPWTDGSPLIFKAETFKDLELGLMGAPDPNSYRS